MAKIPIFQGALMRNDIFGSLLSYVAPGFRIMHKFDLNNPENLDFLNTLSSAVKNITLTTLMGMIGEKSSPSGLEKPPKYQETNIRRRKLAKGDKNKMKRIEQEVRLLGTLKNTVFANSRLE